MPKSLSPTPIFKIKKDGNQTNDKAELDLLAVEEPLEIRLGFGLENERKQKALAVTMRTPGQDFELAIGFLFTENIIQSYQQIHSIRYCTDLGKQAQQNNIVRVELQPEIELDWTKLQRNFYTNSSCGVCGKTSIESVSVHCEKILDTENPKITAKQIHQLPQKLRAAQKVFEHTGGIHATALFDENGNLQMLSEDVGRHNALDKLIGNALIKKQLPLKNSTILLSGRISFELVQKAVKAGVPILAAVGAPSSLAVELARNHNMTLLGFVRNERFNIYTGEKRIV